MNFIKLQDLSKIEIFNLIKRIEEIKNNKNINTFSKNFIVNIFLEPSTRTLYSFIMAAEKLGLECINLTKDNTSFAKGETLFDAVISLKHQGYKNFIIRCSENNYFESLKEIKDINIINAGDGNGNHPSQCLLDLYTLYEEFKKLSPKEDIEKLFLNKKILIVGDLKNSRVYNSNKEVFTSLGMQVYTHAPKEFAVNDNSIKINSLDNLKDFDAVMFLRVQNERHEAKIFIENYNTLHGLNEKNYKTLNSQAFFMHPGPVNRDVEISSSLIYASKSKILNQVENGVYARIAILEMVLK